MSPNPRHASDDHAGAAWIVIAAGVAAAMHVAKLPPALPLLQRELGLGLVQAGFLLSLVQLATMALGIVAGLTADGMGLKRSMAVGLWLLFGAGLAGGWARDVTTLLALRALEGLGFLMATVAAPSLVRRCVAPAQTMRMLGFWGAFMPFGTALALLCGPAVMDWVGWPGWWWLIAALSGVMALAVQWGVPADASHAHARTHAAAPAEGWGARLKRTLGSGGPWLAALTFAAYSAQWLAVIGFLPSLYAEQGWGGTLGAVLTALVAAVNIVGNIVAGRLLSHGVAPERILWTGFAAMALGAFLAYGTFTQDLPVPRYLGAILFSVVGGLIPGGLFALAPRLAPGERTMSTTVGWMMQWSAAGQVAGPPLVGWVAGQVGGWQFTWIVTGACCIVGALLAALIGRRIASMADNR